MRRPRPVSAVDITKQIICTPLYELHLAILHHDYHCVPNVVNPEKKMVAATCSMVENGYFSITYDRKKCDVSSRIELVGGHASALFFESNLLPQSLIPPMMIGPQTVTLSNGKQHTLNPIAFSAYMITKYFQDGITAKLNDDLLHEALKINVRIFFTGLLITNTFHSFIGIMMAETIKRKLMNSSRQQVRKIGDEFDVNLDHLTKGDDGNMKFNNRGTSLDDVIEVAQIFTSTAADLGYTLESVPSSSKAEFLKKTSIYGTAVPIAYRHPIFIKEPGKNRSELNDFPFPERTKSAIAIKCQDGAPSNRIIQFECAFLH